MPYYEVERQIQYIRWTIEDRQKMGSVHPVMGCTEQISQETKDNYKKIFKEKMERLKGCSAVFDYWEEYCFYYIYCLSRLDNQTGRWHSPEGLAAKILHTIHSYEGKVARHPLTHPDVSFFFEFIMGEKLVDQDAFTIFQLVQEGKIKDRTLFRLAH